MNEIIKLFNLGNHLKLCCFFESIKYFEIKILIKINSAINLESDIV